MTTAKKAGFIGLWLKNCYLMGEGGGESTGGIFEWWRDYNQISEIYCRFNIHDLHLMHNTSPILPQYGKVWI